MPVPGLPDDVNAHEMQAVGHQARCNGGAYGAIGIGDLVRRHIGTGVHVGSEVSVSGNAPHRPEDLAVQQQDAHITACFYLACTRRETPGSCMVTPIRWVAISIVILL